MMDKYFEHRCAYLVKNSVALARASLGWHPGCYRRTGDVVLPDLLGVTAVIFRFP